MGTKWLSLGCHTHVFLTFAFVTHLAFLDPFNNQLETELRRNWSKTNVFEKVRVQAEEPFTQLRTLRATARVC
jgi:hypothetical protein